MDDPQSMLGPATVDGVKFCARAFGGYIEDGLRYNANVASVYLFPSEAEAVAFFNDSATVEQMSILDVGIGERYMEGGSHGDLDFLAVGQRGPFIIQLYTWMETVDVRSAMLEMDGNVAPYVSAANPTETSSTTEVANTTTTMGDTQPTIEQSETTASGTAPDGSGNEAIDPEEAAQQAIAGLIAAVAIGLISWGEAAADIGKILGGLPNRGSAIETVPTGFIDPYDQKPLETDLETGMVWWPWDGAEGQWVDAAVVPGLLDDWNRELDAETARRVAIHNAQRDKNWSDLHDRIARSDAEDGARWATDEARLDAFDRYVGGAEGWMEKADANSLGILDRIRQRVANQGYATDADIAEARRIANDSRTYWDTMQRMNEEDWVRINQNHATIVEATAKTAAALINPIAAGGIFGAAESIYDGKGAMATVGNATLGAGLGWAGAKVGGWEPGKAVLGKVGWGSLSGSATAAGETLIRGGTLEDAWTSAKVGFAAGGAGGMVESAATFGRPPPPDLPTIKISAGGPRAGYDTPFNPRLRPPEYGGVGVMPSRVPTIQVRPGGTRPHYDQPLSPRHVDPDDPRYVAPGTPADQVHTPPSDWSGTPQRIIDPDGPLPGSPPSELPPVSPADAFDGQPPTPAPSAPPPTRPPVDVPDGPIPGSKSDWSRDPTEYMPADNSPGVRPPPELPPVSPADAFDGQPPTPAPSAPPPTRPPVDVPDGPIPGSKSDWSRDPTEYMPADNSPGVRPPPELPPVSPADVAEGPIPGSKSDWSRDPTEYMPADSPPAVRPPPELPPVSPADVAEGPIPGSKSDWSRDPTEYMPADSPPAVRPPPELPPVSPADAFDGQPPTPPSGPPPTAPPARPPVDVPDGPIPGSKSDWSGTPQRIIDPDGPPRGSPPSELPPVSPADATGRPPLGDLPERVPPTPDQMLGQARPTMDGAEIVDKAMGQPRYPVPDDLGPQPAAASPGAAGRIDIDAEGRFVIGKRQVGALDPETGMLTNQRGERILIAMDDETHMPIGYLEQPDTPSGLAPAYNARGELAGHVDSSGRAMINGKLTPVAIDADGNLVPYDPPTVATGVDSPSDGVYGQARIRDDAAPVTGASAAPPRTDGEPATGPLGSPPAESAAGGRIDIPSASELDIEARIPVLDADGAPTHFVEPGPREIHFDPDGNPLFAQRTFPAQPAIQRGGGINAPVQEVFDSSVNYHPLAGQNAPPPAPLVGGPRPSGGDAS